MFMHTALIIKSGPEVHAAFNVRAAPSSSVSPSRYISAATRAPAGNPDMIDMVSAYAAPGG